MVTKKSKAPKNAGIRPIVTNYYGTSGKTLLWYNRAKDAGRAMDLAFSHMRQNHYGAFVAEIFNEETGELFGVIIHNAAGKIVTLFEKDPATKMVVTDFDAQLVKEVQETQAHELELINLILKESRLEQRIQEKAYG